MIIDILLSIKWRLNGPWYYIANYSSVKVVRDLTHYIPLAYYMPS